MIYDASSNGRLAVRNLLVQREIVVPFETSAALSLVAAPTGRGKFTVTDLTARSLMLEMLSAVALYVL
jgi:hypothetical protein